MSDEGKAPAQSSTAATQPLGSGTTIKLNLRSQSTRDLAQSARGVRRNTSLSVSGGHLLSHSSHGLRGSSSTNNLVGMAQSVPGKKKARGNSMFTADSLSMSASSSSMRRYGGNSRHLSLAQTTTSSLDSLFENRRMVAPLVARTGYACATCDASLVVHRDGAVATLFHLDVVPNPVAPTEGDDKADDDGVADVVKQIWVREHVWENQYFSAAESKWGREYVDLVGMSPYSSIEMDPLHALPEPWTIGHTSAWVDEWTPVVDGAADHGDDGWKYAVSFSSFVTDADVDTAPHDGANRARRRQLVRHRSIEDTEKGWMGELKNRSLMHSMAKTPLCHACSLKLHHVLQAELDKLTDEARQYDEYLASLGPVPLREADAHASPTDPARMSTALVHSHHHPFSHDPGTWHHSTPEHAVTTYGHGPPRRLLDAPIDLDELSLAELEREARALAGVVQELDAACASTARSRDLVWQCAHDLDRVTKQTFAEAAVIHLSHACTKEERASVGVFGVHASDMLRCLQRYNVFNDAFHIWHEGSFGTINGLRLGRLPSRPVEWAEINAALGQATLLLTTVAQRAGMEFSRNVPVARGSYSKVLVVQGKDKKKEYPLYSDGGFLQRQKFNTALKCFLECVEEAGRQAVTEEPSLRFPYKITRGKIGELSIEVGGNDEQWTRALKYLLTHLKWLLAWVAKRYP